MWRKFGTCDLAAQLTKLRHHNVKRLFRIFELTKNEQRVILIVMFILIVFAFVRYERRTQRPRVQSMSAAETKPSPSTAEIEDGR
jgi:hypothetical protein